jgi:hypothetical protein
LVEERRHCVMDATPPIRRKHVAEQVGEGLAEDAPYYCPCYTDGDGEIVFSSEEEAEEAIELARLEEEYEREDDRELEERLAEHERELYGPEVDSP